MGNFISKFFNKREEVDEEKLQLAADLSLHSASVDVKLLALAANQHKLNFLHKYISKVSAVNLNENLALWKEIENLEIYISTYQTIIGSDVHYKFQNNIDTNFTIQIAPFILFPLVQNAIYFGYNSMEKYPMRVKLNSIGTKIKLEVSNRVNHHMQNQELSVIISNFKSRLTWLYPDSHELIINSNTMLFKATLLIG